MTRKPRVYIDTSVWNFYFAEDVPERRQITRELFDQILHGDYEPYVSLLVLTEVQAAPEPRRSQLEGLIQKVGPGLLQPNEEALELVDQYLAQGTVPEKYSDDAVHIAVAVANSMDILLSWNFAHIVKAKTRRIVSATSKLLGYKEIEICSPEEVIYDAS